MLVPFQTPDNMQRCSYAPQATCILPWIYPSGAHGIPYFFSFLVWRVSRLSVPLCVRWNHSKKLIHFFSLPAVRSLHQLDPSGIFRVSPREGCMKGVANTILCICTAYMPVISTYRPGTPFRFFSSDRLPEDCSHSMAAGFTPDKFQRC